MGAASALTQVADDHPGGLHPKSGCMQHGQPAGLGAFDGDVERAVEQADQPQVGGPAVIRGCPLQPSGHEQRGVGHLPLEAAGGRLPGQAGDLAHPDGGDGCGQPGGRLRAHGAEAARGELCQPLAQAAPGLGGLGAIEGPVGPVADGWQLGQGFEPQRPTGEAGTPGERLGLETGAAAMVGQPEGIHIHPWRGAVAQPGGDGGEGIDQPGAPTPVDRRRDQAGSAEIIGGLGGWAHRLWARRLWGSRL